MSEIARCGCPREAREDAGLRPGLPGRHHQEVSAREGTTFVTYPSVYQDPNDGTDWLVVIAEGGHLVQFKSFGVLLELPRKQVLGEDEVPGAFRSAWRVITCVGEQWRVRKEDGVLVFERRAGQGPKLTYGPPPAGSGFTVDDGSWRNMNEADLCAVRPGS